MPIVEFKDVSRVYESGDHVLRALDHVNMTLDEGKFVVILGPSGAGKSTLLNLLGGLDSPTEGKILVEGKDIAGLSNDALADYRAATVGFVFQFYNLIPTLTMHENVTLVKKIAPDALSATKMLEEVGLADHLNNFPGELSGGEQQRLVIARALLNDPQVLLADEPTGNLDPVTADGIMQLFQKIASQGCAVVMSTHNTALIENYPARAVLFSKGKIREVDLKAELA